MPRPAPVIAATRPSKLCLSTPTPPSGVADCASGLVRRRRGGKRRLEPEKVAEGAAHHGVPLVPRHAGEELVHQLPAAAERPLCVRVVVAPHNRREAGGVAAGDGGG